MQVCHGKCSELETDIAKYDRYKQIIILMCQT